MPRALVVTGRDEAEVQDVALSPLADREILVKTKAVALNPTDWKALAFRAPEGTWLGCDFAGIVEAVGAGVSHLKVGDPVAGMAPGNQVSGQGAFATHVRIEAGLVWKCPSTLDWEEAAALGGVGPHTAYLVLYLRLGLNRPDNPTKKGELVFIYGASSSVGLYAVQLAAASGYRVIATASPKNHALLKSLGAIDVFDYNDTEFPAKIAEKYPEGIRYGLDGIAEGQTIRLSAQTLAPGGHLCTLLFPDESIVKSFSDIKIETPVAYTLLGVAFTIAGRSFDVQPDDKAALEDWSKFFPSLVESGKVKANPLLRQPGGLNGVRDALKVLRKGVSAGKVTVAF